METLAASIGGLGATVFRWSLAAFVLLNGAAVAAVLLTRSQALVSRWTSRWVAANMLLLATGLGVPAVTVAMKLVINAVTASQGLEVRVKDK